MIYRKFDFYKEMEIKKSLMILLFATQILFITIFVTIHNAKSFKQSITAKQNTINERFYLTGLFQSLKNMKLFLIDIDILNQLQNSIKLPKMLTFGINEINLPFNLTLNNCQKLVSNGIFFSKEKRITNIFLKCEYSIQIQIAIFYKRNNYTWIGSNDDKINFNTKWFGDVPRLMSEINATKLVNIENYQILVPKDIKRFLYDYNHSSLQECNYSLAELNFNRTNGTYKQNTKKTKQFISSLEYIISVLESRFNPYWIASGTLLGWYRDCGIIPFTPDVDIAMKIDYYDQHLFDIFLGNNKTNIFTIFGFVDDGWEIQLIDKRSRYDIFFIYNLNETYQYYTYHLNNLKYKQLLPHFDDLCSAELIDIKVMVPCDPVSYLTYMYGPIDNWKIPQEKNYTWPFLDLKNGVKWSDERKHEVVKFYYSNGTFYGYMESPY